LYRKKFGSKIAWASRKEGGGGSEYINGLWSVMTHIEATGRYVKELGCMSG
jgi:hypothetical protein